MPDINKMISDPETTNPDIKDHELDLEGWTREQGLREAKEEGIEMTEAHWQVVDFLREHYREHGRPSSGRDVAEALETAFAKQGGGTYLHTLFPKGPVAQGSRIGGVPMPPYTEDSSFGSTF